MDSTAWVKILLCVLCSFGAKKGKYVVLYFYAIIKFNPLDTNGVCTCHANWLHFITWRNLSLFVLAKRWDRGWDRGVGGWVGIIIAAVLAGCRKAMVGTG